MCGIVGYLGKNGAENVILEGLKRLEYRGYDSSGIAMLSEGELKIAKFKGRLANLDKYLTENPGSSPIAIGHTRWATHGEPSDTNSHPHFNMAKTIAVVHNGIIENYHSLKNELSEKGYTFSSETDTETIPHLIDSFYEGDLLSAVLKTVPLLRGSFAIAVVCADKKEIVAARKESPMVIGVGDNGDFFVASDVLAVLSYTKKFYYPENNDIIRITENGVEFFDANGSPVTRELKTVELSADAATKCGYDHFMLKEIYEQPDSCANTVSRYCSGDDIELDLGSIKNMSAYDSVYIVACGTAYHAGLVGKLALEKYVKIPTTVDIASEFRYYAPFVNERSLVILISQSGETADTLATLRNAKAAGATVLSITNVAGSSIARESDDVINTAAGPEIAVASTKAFTSQITALFLLAVYLGKQLGNISDEEYSFLMSELHSIPQKLREVLADMSSVKSAAKRIEKCSQLFYIGRGLDRVIAMEGALKLKEISYIYTEAFPAGEMKHGPIALIEPGTPAVALVTQESAAEKTISNIKELKARGAYVIAIANTSLEELRKTVDFVIEVPDAEGILAAIPAIIPCQALAYYTSIYKGNDVDKPRNLAKSVTVE